MKNRLVSFALIILSILLSSCTKTEQPLSAAEFLDLGEKYLLEMDYEQALVQFTKAIEVEPMNPRGYIGMADAYIGLEQINEAKYILKKGASILTDNEALEGKLLELDTILIPSPVETALPSSASVAPQLSDAKMEYLKQAYDYMINQNFIEMTTGFNEKTILEAGYRLDGNLQQDEFLRQYTYDGEQFYLNFTGKGLKTLESVKFFYYGDIVEGIANGKGISFIFNLGPIRGDGWYRPLNWYEGEWSDDLPNGHGVYYQYMDGLYDEIVIDRYEGSFKNGLFHGEIIKSRSSDSINATWLCNYKDGIPIVEERWIEDDFGNVLLPPTSYSYSYAGSLVSGPHYYRVFPDHGNATVSVSSPDYYLVPPDFNSGTLFRDHWK